MKPGDGLEEIGERAFLKCTSLCVIIILPAVEAIKAFAFSFCVQLTAVIIGDGVEDIGLGHLSMQIATRHHDLPITQFDWGSGIFGCSGLTTVQLGNRLGEIGNDAFGSPALSRSYYFVPPISLMWCSVTKSKSSSCLQSRCGVGGIMVGVHEKYLRTYCFLLRCNTRACGSYPCKELAGQCLPIAETHSFHPPTEVWILISIQSILSLPNTNSIWRTLICC